jgi:hypothetical protein
MLTVGYLDPFFSSAIREFIWISRPMEPAHALRLRPQAPHCIRHPRRNIGAGIIRTRAKRRRFALSAHRPARVPPFIHHANLHAIARTRNRRINQQRQESGHKNRHHPADLFQSAASLKKFPMLRNLATRSWIVCSGVCPASSFKACFNVPRSPWIAAS